MRIGLLVVCGLGLAAAEDVTQRWEGGRLSIQIRAGAVGNLAWQLDTLIGRTNTAPKDYEDLWRKDLEWGAEDARMLGKWSALHARHRRARTAIHGRAVYPPNYARFYGSATGRDYAFRIAAAEAEDFERLRERYAALCGERCAGEFIDVLRHFWPRFKGWWEKEGLTTAQRFVPEMAGLMTKHGLGELCETAARVTASRVPARHVLGIDVMVHPKAYLTNMSATVMENHVLTELTEDEKVGGVRMPLLIHELTHHLYDFAGEADHLRLIERFAARPEAYSMAAYSLLNEGLACGIQLMVEKRMRPAAEFGEFVATDENIYFDPFIARAGRALLPVMERWVAEGRTVFDDEFVEAYLRAFGREMGPLVASPRLILSSRVQIHGPKGKAASHEFRQLVRGISTQEEWKDLRAAKDLGGVVFLTKGEMGLVRRNGGVVPGTVVKAVTEAARGRGTFVYGWRRTAKAMVFFVYGEDEARLLEAVRAFAKNDAGGVGLW